MGPCVWRSRLTVPPDGLCMLYAFLAACDPVAWSQVCRSDVGFIQDLALEGAYRGVARGILDAVLSTMESKGMVAAQRLAAGGHPGLQIKRGIFAAFSCLYEKAIALKLRIRLGSAICRVSFLDAFR